MKMTIKEFANLSGVSVRTLHYYDEIGLLNPSFVDEQTGYRFYDEISLERMQEIMFYRELEFSLKRIQEILSSPNYDTRKAFEEQKRLLTLKKERLERIISAVDYAMKGENIMKVFDNSEFEKSCNKYEAEVKEKWGHTDAYTEYANKSKGYSKEKYASLADGMEQMMGAFALCMKKGEKPDAAEAQELVKKLQNFITENYYTCTNEILSGLGQMYVGDERFMKNIDKHGKGTAQYISEAISVYCK
jgi:DNA-binding transcriptional MerR regulator